MNGGIEWLIDASGCHPEMLADLRALRDVCAEVIETLDLHVMGEPVWHQFPPPGGVTGLHLLRESHLTCHTFPESGVATFNLYCCRPRPEFDWDRCLKSALGAGVVRVHAVARGGAAAVPGRALHDRSVAAGAEVRR